MLRSWENFLSPTGGSMDNLLEYGMLGIGIDFGSSLIAKHIYDPLEKGDIYKVKSNYSKKLVALRESKFTKASLTGGGYGPAHPTRRILDRASYLPEKAAMRATKNAEISSIKSKFNSLRTGARFIGWAYLAVGMEQVVESLATPGLSLEAKRSNERTMGYSQPMDSPQAYTQRQRALQAIFDSQSAARNVFGNESSYFHK